MEEERDHALDRPGGDESEASIWAEEEGLLAAANRTERTLGLEDEGSFEALESDAHFDHVLFDARQYGLHAASGSEEEQDYLGLPGLLEPDQVAALLHERQAKQAKSSRRPVRFRFSRTRSKMTIVSLSEYPRMVSTAATVGSDTSSWSAAISPSAKSTSCAVAMIAATPKRHSKRNAR